MGIRGLTTYINNRSHLYLETYELHDTTLVIDGNGLASNLYKWHCKSNDCFTGDYDKYAHVIKNFFQLLKDCNILSYVIFDGGYEHKKLATVASRMKSKILTADKLNPVTEGSLSVFPLFIREVFLDVITELGVKCARCDYEGDTEIANVAKVLNCPVLSYDSDFYIYGCLYIPFNTVELKLKKGKIRSTQQVQTYTYLPCKIYKVEKFLNSFGGLDQNNLPILAVLLGNDYVKGSTFAPFFRNLKIQKVHGIQSNQQKRIKSVIVWLQNETPESAIKTVLGRFKSQKRQVVLKKIKKAMSSYFSLNTELLDFLEIKVDHQKPNEINIDEIVENLDSIIEDLCEKEPSDEEDIEQNEESEENSDDSDSEMSDELPNEIDEDKNDSSNEINKLQLASVINKINEKSDDSDAEMSDKLPNKTDEDKNDSSNKIETSQLASIINKCQNNKINKLDPVFLRNFRKCQYPSCFMDLITLNKYYCIPQCEETTSNYSHEISLEILGIIYKTLTNNEKSLMVLTRYKTSIKSFLLPLYMKDVPSLEDILKSSAFTKKEFLLKFLNIDPIFIKIVSLFPEEWHLFLYSLKYALTKSNFDLALIYSLIFCFQILNYVDPKIGFYRSIKAFEKKYLNHLRNEDNNNSNCGDESFMFTFYECLKFMNKMVSYFQMDLKLREFNFERSLVHKMAELQSCFLHVKHLNCLLDYPFANVRMDKLFNGTYIYNMTINLRKRTELNKYLETLLSDCPSFLSTTDGIAKNFEDICPKIETVGNKKPRRKRKKKKSNNDESVDNDDIGMDSESEHSVDPNNFFSVLSII